MRFLPMLFLLVSMFGCDLSRSVPKSDETDVARQLDLATVKEHLTADQRLLGDPIRNSIGMLMVPIPAGEFLMGSPEPSKGNVIFDSEKPQHLVIITKPFYLSVGEVTQQQYVDVMGDQPWKNKSNVIESPEYPASSVSWNDAVEFCRKLSEQEGVEYSLPTAAQWEYACRAGTTTPYCFGSDRSKVSQYAWYNKNTIDIGERHPHAVGQKLPNPWGLHDMHGNVWEWCQDWYAPYGSNTLTDPSGPANGQHRTMRGGAYECGQGAVTSDVRLASFPSSRFHIVGFRPIRRYDSKRAESDNGNHEID